MTLAGYNLQDNVYIYSNNKCMCVFLISPVPITEPLTSELIDTPVFYNLAPRPIKYRVSVPIPIYVHIQVCDKMRTWKCSYVKQTQQEIIGLWLHKVCTHSNVPIYFFMCLSTCFLQMLDVYITAGQKLIALNSKQE